MFNATRCFFVVLACITLSAGSVSPAEPSVPSWLRLKRGDSAYLANVSNRAQRFMQVCPSVSALDRGFRPRASSQCFYRKSGSLVAVLGWRSDSVFRGARTVHIASGEAWSGYVLDTDITPVIPVGAQLVICYHCRPHSPGSCGIRGTVVHQDPPSVKPNIVIDTARKTRRVFVIDLWLNNGVSIALFQ